MIHIIYSYIIASEKAIVNNLNLTLQIFIIIYKKRHSFQTNAIFIFNIGLICYAILPENILAYGLFKTFSTRYCSE